MKRCLLLFLLFPFMISQINPLAPGELSRFDFIIGDWVCQTEYKAENGKILKYHAKWKGYYLTNKLMIADDFIVEDENNRLYFYGTTFRTYNKNSKSWDMRFYDGLSTKWMELTGNHDNSDEIHLTAKGSDTKGDFITKITFYNIKKDSFDWKSDQSYDNGKTWIKDYYKIFAKRKK
jgi:hypothetical protein